jgi:hypothetical protein
MFTKQQFVLGFRGIVRLSDHRNLGPFPAVVEAYRRRIVVRCEDVIYPLARFALAPNGLTRHDDEIRMRQFK